MSSNLITVRRVDSMRPVRAKTGFALELAVDLDEQDQRRMLASVLETVSGEVLYGWLCELAPDFVAEIRGEVRQ